MIKRIMCGVFLITLLALALIAGFTVVGIVVLALLGDELKELVRDLGKEITH